MAASENFVGKVRLRVYWGTPFDDVNIPFWNSLIRDSAEKTVEYDGIALWETTYVTAIKINVENYQEIVGAQYVEMIETEESVQHGAHWYTILGYRMRSAKSVELGLAYDPLLSIQPAFISGINGWLTRWSVDDDSAFRWYNTPEPIDQSDRNRYSYTTVSTLVDGELIQFTGFPYDMDTPIDINLNYTNSDGTQTGIAVPHLETTTEPTNFRTSIGGNDAGIFYNDGMTYYKWDESPTAKENYAAACGLGSLLDTCSFFIPNSLSFAYTYRNVGGNRKVTNLFGASRDIETGMALTDGSYNNRKARELGISFCLYNEVTGDQVEVSNSQLNNTLVTVQGSPYIGGYLAARFTSYMLDTEGSSGMVRSAPFQAAPITTNTGLGTATNTIQNAMDGDAMAVAFANQQATLNTNMNAARLSNNTSLVGGVIGTIANAATGNLGGALNSATGLINSGVDRRNAELQYMTALDNLSRTRAQQGEALRVQGSLGQFSPPPIKGVQGVTPSNISYTFSVRRATLSAKDRQNADQVLTAFGYNVVKYPLSDPQQLQTRSRFTWVQADDVNITSVYGSTDLTRLRDWRSHQLIQERFAAGLRIWRVVPDYDFSKNNPIVVGGFNDAAQLKILAKGQK